MIKFKNIFLLFICSITPMLAMAYEINDSSTYYLLRSETNKQSTQCRKRIERLFKFFSRYEGAAIGENEEFLPKLGRFFCAAHSYKMNELKTTAHEYSNAYTAYKFNQNEMTLNNFVNFLRKYLVCLIKIEDRINYFSNTILDEVIPENPTFLKLLTKIVVINGHILRILNQEINKLTKSFNQYNPELAIHE